MALFTLVSAYGFPAFTEAALDSVQFNPTRIDAQIVAGVEVLGRVRSSAAASTCAG